MANQVITKSRKTKRRKRMLTMRRKTQSLKGKRPGKVVEEANNQEQKQAK